MNEPASPPLYKSNGKVPPSMPSIWESTLLRDALQRAFESLIDRYFRTYRLSITVRGITLTLSLSQDTGTTIALGIANPGDPCPSPDPEPSKDQSTATGTLA